MSREVIAVIRLAYGEVGYYDELSRIYLTASNPQRDVLAGTNCTQLRRSVKSGRLRLLSGSLGEEKKLDFSKKGNKFTGIPQVDAPVQAAIITQPPVDEKVTIVDTPVVEGSIIESGVIEIETVRPIEEIEIVEAAEATIETVETATEENTKKAGRKKTSNKQEVV